MRLRFGLSFLTLVCLSFGTAGAAGAIERFTTRPGDTVIIAASQKEIVPDGTLPAEAHVYKDLAAARWLISYTADKDGDGKEAQFAYRIGGDSVQVRVLVEASPDYQDPDLVFKAGRILFSMLVLALILESALAVLFNWRVFLEFFDGRGVRTLVMFVAACMIVWGLNQDFVAALFSIYTGAAVNAHLGTGLLAALVLAGGSASVNKLMVGLGARENRKAESEGEKGPKNKAWVSITADGKGKAGFPEPVFHVLSAPIPSTAVSADCSEIVGVIYSRSIGSRLGRYFWRDVHSVPMSGGREVSLNTLYSFVVQAQIDGKVRYKDVLSNELTFVSGTNTFTPPPAIHKFADGAIVDFLVTFK